MADHGHAGAHGDPLAADGAEDAPWAPPALSERGKTAWIIAVENPGYSVSVNSHMSFRALKDDEEPRWEQLFGTTTSTPSSSPSRGSRCEPRSPDSRMS